MDEDALISKMRGRIEQCRRLATSTTDQRAARILRQMAEEGERDVRQLQTERAKTESAKSASGEQ